MSKIHVHGVVELEVISDPELIALTDSPLGKPFLKMVFRSTTGDIMAVHNITTNLAEMIGGAGHGVRLRQEDQQKAKSAPEGWTPDNLNDPPVGH